MLRDRLGVSERRACRYVGQHRSTQRHEPTGAAGDDQALSAQLRQISERKPRWGYRRAHARLREQGWQVNRKRCSDCDVRKACASPRGRANAAVSAREPARTPGCAPSAPTRCGHWTTWPTRPPTAGCCGC